MFINIKMKSKKLTIIIAVIFGILIVNIASAEFWACFNKNEIINYCNPKVPDRTCGTSQGCIYCMNDYNSNLDCYNQGNWQVCNTLQMQCSVDGNHSVDGTAPEITLTSPEQDAVYDSRSLPIEISANEKVDLLYYDNLDPRARWKRICNGCYTYSNKRRFNEGFNDITFKAVDLADNEAFETVTFYVDSKKPRIKRTFPRKGFADGNFEVRIAEDNPTDLLLHYGNYFEGYRTKQLNLESDCFEDRRTQVCTTSVDLEDYDSQTINYWFNLTDMAETSVESRHINLEVDTTFPVIENFDYTIDGRYVYFDITINELNFDEITYLDHADTRPRERRLCSRLRDGQCEIRKSFKRGHHVLDIQVLDKAGNSVARQIDFIIDY